MSRVAQGKIVFLLSMLVMIFVLLSYLSIDRLMSAETIRTTDELVESIHRISLDLFRTDVNFYRHDVSNNGFFKTGTSIRLRQHDSLIAKATQLIARAETIENFSIDDDLDTIKATLTKYDTAFKVLVRKVKRRGYKDYGVEGELRNFAHELENKSLIASEEILMLRRHEKDFLLRHEEEYVTKFDNLVQSLQKKYANRPHALALLKSYSEKFHELVAISSDIGMERQEGVKEKVDQLTTRLAEDLGKLSDHAEAVTVRTHENGLLFFTIAVLLGTAMIIFLIVRIAMKI